MKDLINIQIKDNQQLVSARDLYKGLELKGRFSRWFKINSEFFTENEDFYKCTSSTIVGNGAKRELEDFLITVEMAKQLAMMARTEKSKLYREYFLRLEKNWNSPDMIMQRALSISKQRIEALQNENAAMNLGLFKIKETTINHSNGTTSISKTPKVTGKGQQYFINKFLKEHELVNSYQKNN